MKLSKRIIFSACIGTFLEYFDYTIYGFSAPIIAQLFFPSENPEISLLMAWSAFSISFLIRPLGAFIFGHYGDKLGRRRILSMSIILMAIPTTLLGLLPTYTQIGIFAPILLVLCRLLQGFAVSAEYNGSSIYLIELTTHRKGLAAGMIPCACGLGILASSLLVMFFVPSHTNLATSHYIDSWRIPFIIAGISVGLIGFYLRQKLPETLEFLQAREQQALIDFPFKTALKTEKRNLLLSVILSAYVGTATYTLMVFMASYLQSHVGISAKLALLLTSLLGAVEAISAPLFGALGDKVKRIKILTVSAILMCLLVIPLFLIIQASSLFGIIISLIFLALLLAAFDGNLPAFLPGLFKVSIRYSAVATSFNLGAAVIGGLAPFILSFLLNKTKIDIMPAFYLVGFSLVAIFFLARAYPKER